MAFISSFEAARMWGVSPRVVQELCAAGRVAGARKYARAWMIPEGAAKPLDPRKTRVQAPASAASALPFGVPNFLLTRFYTMPGSADALPDRLEIGEARTLCRALLAYYRADDEAARRAAEELAAGSCGFETRVGAALVLAMCALYDGSAHRWNRARAQLYALEQSKPDSAAL